MIAFLLLSGGHAFGAALISFGLGVVVGYAFRGKEHAALQAGYGSVQNEIGKIENKF